MLFIALTLLLSSPPVLGDKLSSVDKNDLTKMCQLVTNGVCLPHNYDKYEAPAVPIDVQVSIAIKQITDVNDVHEGTLGMLMEMSFIWQDSRLLKINANSTIDFGGEKNHRLNPEWERKLWFPDVCISGLQEIRMVEINNWFVGRSKCKLTDTTAFLIVSTI